MIIDWLTETLRAVLSAQLPYLWMILLSTGLFCMLFAVMFVNIKNGPVGWLAFVMTAGVMEKAGNASPPCAVTLEKGEPDENVD